MYTKRGAAWNFRQARGNPDSRMISVILREEMMVSFATSSCAEHDRDACASEIATESSAQNVESAKRDGDAANVPHVRSRLNIHNAVRKAAFGLGLLLTLLSPAMGQQDQLTTKQSDALNTYGNAVERFKAILRQRRAQISSNQPLPNLPGQALYLARNDTMSAYRDLTDVLPSKIGRPNKFAIPPAYFDADNEPLLDEYFKLFDVLDAPPANAQKSDTPFKDVVELGMAIARAKGLDAATAETAGRISLGVFFAETNGIQNAGNARSKTYKGSFQTGPSEDQIGQKKWAAIKQQIASLDPALNARDDKEEARAGKADHRFNHWTAVRDGLMSTHADIFPQVAAIAKLLPDPIDQMKLFELLQIIPTPTRAALRSGNLLSTRISDPTIMGYLRNNSIFAYGQADKARGSATFREILDAMWLFNAKFEQARAKFDEIGAR
jgi:hypothetical protein